MVLVSTTVLVGLPRSKKDLAKARWVARTLLSVSQIFLVPLSRQSSSSSSVSPTDHNHSHPQRLVRTRRRCPTYRRHL
jgi:hypothetical protein